MLGKPDLRAENRVSDLSTYQVPATPPSERAASPDTENSDSGALFGELVEVVRDRLGKDIESFAMALAKAAGPDHRNDFAGSLADLRQLESLGKP